MCDGSSTEPGTIPFGSAFRFWLKLGFISFGGPAGQIAVMHQELVERRRWIGEKRFLHALNYTMLLPGPEAQQLATYIGWLMHGTLGGLVAGLLFVLPSLVLLMVLSWVYLVYGDVAIVSGVLYGIKPAVTAIVLFAAYRIGSRVLKNPMLWMIAGLGFVLIFALRVPFPLIVIGAGVLGLVLARWFPHWFQPSDTHQSARTSGERAIIDDDNPLAPHHEFRWWRFVTFLVTGVALGCAALWTLSVAFGETSVFVTLGTFFTKAALVTFGGAYAVLPYVYQGGVDTYGWLTAPQMMDGLALGETTPGPLIMVVAFVGFLGGWNLQALGPDALAMAGVLGAAVATFFTFLPSFLFIFLGAPWVERTRGDITFVAPLTAITAVVVGVIVNLACFFAFHVLWPSGWNGQFDFFAALLAVLAFVALFWRGMGIITVIFLSGVIGLMYSVLL
ncbi:MAG: chromate efflux transporter [Pseudomonadota bacterium]